MAAKLRANGVSEGVIAREVYRPFILEGPAAWSDSWHAPRYAGGFHLHEGQDVLCRYGAPVLAAEPGRLEFGSNSLGGLVAYIRQPDGGFLLLRPSVRVAGRLERQAGGAGRRDRVLRRLR